MTLHTSKILGNLTLISLLLHAKNLEMTRVRSKREGGEERGVGELCEVYLQTRTRIHTSVTPAAADGVTASTAVGRFVCVGGGAWGDMVGAKMFHTCGGD